MNRTDTLIFSEGKFLGVISIKHTNNASYKIGDILPVETKETWTLDDIKNSSKRQISILYLAELSAKQIQEDLIIQANIRAGVYTKLDLIPF